MIYYNRFNCESTINEYNIPITSLLLLIAKKTTNVFSDFGIAFKTKQQREHYIKSYKNLKALQVLINNNTRICDIKQWNHLAKDMRKIQNVKQYVKRYQIYLIIQYHQIRYNYL